MRNIIVFSMISALSFACDSSSGSKSAPVVTELAPIPPAGGGDDATKPDTDPNQPGTETNPNGDALNLRLGLTTTRVELLKNLGADLSVRAQSFRQAADALNASVNSYCQSPAEENRSDVQSKWKEAMKIWQYFEVFQVGPVSENAKVLKYNIYAWPDPANLCKVDEEALKASKSATYKLPPNNNRKGLQAVEYLLFENSFASRCAAGTAVANEWNAQAPEQKVATRCAYLKPLAQDLAVHAATLESKWGAPADNYLSRLLGNVEKEQQTIQSLYENLYYVDLEVKNQKMAAPAGLDVKHCTTSPVPCNDKAEFLFSGYSREALDVNITAFVDLFFGSQEAGRNGGFSALVRAEGANGSGNAVADRTEALVSELAKTGKSESGLSLNDLIAKHAQENCDASTNSWLCKTRSAIRRLFTDLKAEYASILKVKAPEAAAGDND